MSNLQCSCQCWSTEGKPVSRAYLHCLIYIVLSSPILLRKHQAKIHYSVAHTMLPPASVCGGQHGLKGYAVSAIQCSFQSQSMEGKPGSRVYCVCHTLFLTASLYEGKSMLKDSKVSVIPCPIRPQSLRACPFKTSVFGHTDYHMHL